MAQMLTQNDDGEWVPVSSTDPLPMSGGVTTTSSVITVINASTSSVALDAQNGARRGLVIFNDSDFNLFVALGGTASSSNFTWLVLPHTGWSLPVNYTGAVNGAWASGVGSAKVTELA